MGTLMPFVGMVIVILAQVGNMVVIKAALSRGINRYVLIAYSNFLSTLILLPCSFVFNRSERLPLTFSIVCKFFLQALVLIVVQVSRYTGLDYSSPTLDTAMLNLVPAFTFLLAVTFRMEKLDWKSRSSQAKTLGTLTSIAGAFVVTFYKGPKMTGTQSFTAPTSLLLFSPQLKWILGALLLATEAFMTSVWYILQAMILRRFPAIVTVVFFVSFFNTIMAAVYALILVNDTSAWKLRLDIGLIAVLYSALASIILINTLASWCLSKTGALFVTMFKPLGIIFAVVMGVLFSGDALYLGSMIGAIIIVTGFYAVIWGKANEEEKSSEDNGLESSKSSSETVPLLQNKTEDMNSSI
ncbi:hypothetical protein SLEP1_g32651 [Rubroshorea leprosula]|uniref:WAT1-related protein n=1 Tax=Rubroshorea leprosula TaxID=152421 RepID=A0AAV5KE23_9ROSI|nr:hypothetical protein SLEP1_g32651 [Rubroshorea leprosula]